MQVLTEPVLEEIAKSALEGTLTDADRVMIYRIALTVAANELFRIESESGGTVDPSALFLLQQLSMLADPETKRDAIIASIREMTNGGEEERATT